MKKNIHPKNYRLVVFADVNNDFKVLTRSTVDVEGGETILFEDGNTYPLVKVQISSASHPFYTGKRAAIDKIRFVAKFLAKYGKKK